MSPFVCIFWDISNIFIPAKELAKEREGWAAEREIRIEFENLLSLARAAREIKQAVCVGSAPVELNHVWDKLRGTGALVEVFERGSSTGTEQGVDQCLQVHMLRAIVDIEPPGVCVLLTGDGAGYESGVGFHADLARMAKRDWGIEVISWDFACNKKLKAWAQEVGVYLPLEDYYESVTFRQGGRWATPLKMRKRRMAFPRERS